MKTWHYLSNSFLLFVALLAFGIQSHAANFEDVMHLTDDYPACTFSPIDAKTGKPVKNVSAVAEWYKNVTIMEYATEPCREKYRVEPDLAEFSIPAARCSGFRHGTTLEIRVKALGYRLKKFRILRHQKSSDFIPFITYLSIKDCGKTAQQLPLDKIQSLEEALRQYQDSYERGQIRTIFGDEKAYHGFVISELRSFESGLDASGARKAYCEAVLKDMPINLHEVMVPYCKDLK